MNLSEGACNLPCNPGGGSPSLLTVKQRIISPLITKRNLLWYTSCSLTSEKSTRCTITISRRVERPNLKRSTKGLTLTPSLKFVLFPVLTLFSKPGIIASTRIRPCNPNGGSPFLLKEKQCLIGSLITKRNWGSGVSCSLTSEKSTRRLIPISRRVERSNLKRPTKGFSGTCHDVFKNYALGSLAND